jgi:hypothetical protein
MNRIWRFLIYSTGQKRFETINGPGFVISKALVVELVETQRLRNLAFGA